MSRTRLRRVLRALAILAIAAAGIFVISSTIGKETPGTSTTSAPAAEDPSAEGLQAEEQAVVIAITDGDTIRADLGKIRIIGIDTPEQGECGSTDAAAALEALIPAGSNVTLTLPEGQNDVDRYGRLLRYVTTARGDDVGLALIESGHAVARYDSTDGYPAHPKQADYHAAQHATLTPEGEVITSQCAAAQ